MNSRFFGTSAGELPETDLSFTALVAVKLIVSPTRCAKTEVVEYFIVVYVKKLQSFKVVNFSALLGAVVGIAYLRLRDNFQRSI